MILRPSPRISRLKLVSLSYILQHSNCNMSTESKLSKFQYKPDLAISEKPTEESKDQSIMKQDSISSGSKESTKRVHCKVEYDNPKTVVDMTLYNHSLVKPNVAPFPDGVISSVTVPDVAKVVPLPDDSIPTLLSKTSRQRDYVVESSSPMKRPRSEVEKSAPRFSGKVEKVLGLKVVEPNPYWEEHLRRIHIMRSTRSAPVDYMGCEKCSDPDAPAPIQRFQLLVSLMLSSQTKDEVTYAACKRLQTELEGGFTPTGVQNATEERIRELIYPVGFYTKKAIYIKEAASVLLKEYGGDIPPTSEAIQQLKGVGPKMASILMNAAWGKPVAIGVDVHLHRIANRLKWVDTKEPEQTRQHLERWLPKEYWSGINVMLVGFGQQVCHAVNPLCSQCLNEDICPAAKKRTSSS